MEKQDPDTLTELTTSKPHGGWSRFGERLAKLMDVKSIVTLVSTGVFATLALTQVISGGDFLQVFLIIVGFYFGTQAQKKTGGGDGSG